MSDLKSSISIGKLRLIAEKWREANIPGNNIDLNRLADYTLKVIDSEPLIKEICNAFLCSISIQAIKDPNFDRDTYENVANSNIVKKIEERKVIKEVKKNVNVYKHGK